MLYLAKVTNQKPGGRLSLSLLAHQVSAETWTILSESPSVTCQSSLLIQEGLLVLVEISEAGEITSIEDATDWILELVKNYLTKGITPDFLEKEAEKAEKWRQALALKSQELSRRRIETEARREQIETLEETLKREKRLLRMMAAKLRQQPH